MAAFRYGPNSGYLIQINRHPRSLTVYEGIGADLGSLNSTSGFERLPCNNEACDSSDDYQYPLR